MKVTIEELDLDSSVEAADDWLKCLRCGAHLAEVFILDGWTCIKIGSGYVIEMKLLCSCGAVRKFFSGQLKKTK